MELAARAGVSGRHLSFLETGRSRASEQMIGRLAEALRLGSQAHDRLRLAGGFSSKHSIETLSQRAFECVWELKKARDVQVIVRSMQQALDAYGFRNFFVGMMSKAGGNKCAFDWLDVGDFPNSWRRRYDREQCAATDPLLFAVRDGAKAFFWEDVLGQYVILKPAREMFDRVRDEGISTGFVVAKKRRGRTAIVSMMSSHADLNDPSLRIGLEFLGERLIDRLDEIGALPLR